MLKGLMVGQKTARVEIVRNKKDLYLAIELAQVLVPRLNLFHGKLLYLPSMIR